MLDQIDSSKKELALHGNSDFPLAVYIDKYEGNGYPLHWHNEFEFAYVTDGEICATVDEKEIVLTEGQGIFINSKMLHSYCGKKNVYSEMPNILFSPMFLADSEYSAIYQKYVMPFTQSSFSYIKIDSKTEWQKQILFFAAQIISLFYSKKYGYEMKIRNLACEIFYEICANNSVLPVKQSDQRDYERCRKMIAFISDHFHEKILIKDIASSVNVSNRECLRCFKKIVDTSPMKIVEEYRINKAKYFLCNTDLSISEIGALCGYQDQSYFTKIFSSIELVSPGKFRSKYQAD